MQGRGAASAVIPVGQRASQLPSFGGVWGGYSPPFHSAEGRLLPKGRKKGRGRGWGL